MDKVTEGETDCFVCGKTITAKPSGTSEARLVGEGTPVCSDRCEKQLLTAELQSGPKMGDV